MDQTEMDVNSVRSWCKAAHVDDPNAMKSLDEGNGIFDVSPNGQKLDAFVVQHSLQNQIYRNSFSGLIGHRKIHFAFKSKPN